MIKQPEALLDIRISDADLNNLERLGAFFTSQIHDLNNQMAVLSNAELLWEISGLETPQEMADFLARVFTAIHRLSAMCEQFNLARKTYTLEVEKISVEEGMMAVFGVTGDIKGWSASGKATPNGVVHLNVSWVSTVIPHLIRHLASQEGKVSVSVGSLPLRQYQLGLRNPTGAGEKKVFMVHFEGEGAGTSRANPVENSFGELQITLELIRLMGAALSMGRSDNHRDYLLAFPMS